LVELALELQPRTVLDVGTGSGAVALAIADELPGCEVTATDTSAGALVVAAVNAEQLGLAERVRFLEGTLPEGEQFELIVANMPYVAEREWGGLAPEVTRWEPREALLAGLDGLDAIRTLLSDSVRRLCRSEPQTANGRSVLALEVGDGQAPAVSELLRDAGFSEVETRHDLAGIARVVIGRREPA
jgi:release factor glutamine methyltransferase